MRNPKCFSLMVLANSVVGPTQKQESFGSLHWARVSGYPGVFEEPSFKD